MKDPVVIEITRANIELTNTQPVEELLDSFTSGNLELFRNRIVFAVLGYDDDERELYEIQEVRRYFIKLFSEIDGLFYWIHTGYNMVQLIGLLLYRPVYVEGQVTLSTEDWQSYLMWGYMKLNKFCSENGVSPEPTSTEIGNIFR